MRKNIIPITDLRKTNEISKLVQEDEPIFITKNGYCDMVLMSNQCYERIIENEKGLSKDPYIKNIHYNKNNISQEDISVINIASSSLDVHVGNVSKNIEEIKKVVEDLESKKVAYCSFPELSLCGYSCGDLFTQSTLLENVKKGLKDLKAFSKDKNILFFVGAPLQHKDSLYNCSIAIQNGHILAIFPKRYIPNYKEFYEGRYFKSYHNENDIFTFDNEDIYFGNKIILQNDANLEEIISCEICEDAWASHSPSLDHANAGAKIIFNLSSSNELINKEDTRLTLVKEASRKLCCAYIYTSSSYLESTTDLLFSSSNIVAECGDILVESELFFPNTVISSIDLERIANTRRYQNTFMVEKKSGFCTIHFIAPRNKVSKVYNRKLSKFPFVYSDFSLKEVSYSKILMMQALSLARRMKAIHCEKVVLGLSGGLDSTLALLVCHKAFEILNIDKKNIICITLPCFGTSKRTYNNALTIANKMGNTLLEIDISDAVMQHLKDIDHLEHNYDITYENAQARERTKILMDYANKINGLVIGTGDLSEIALGWSTYNGDHMSMYAVNASIPKTLIRAMFAHFAQHEYSFIKEVLLDILDTPISPELIPSKDGTIDQKTEDIVGPYQLNDFFLYHYMNEFYSFKKIYYLALVTFENVYSKEEIKKWIINFIKRFFTSQFKRSCMPDGCKITSISLSPRGDLRLPSDVDYYQFIQEINELD